ncbi:hypothetical protein C8N40_11247 [Pontibacter mucosus]|uniref:Uncharacterized protein n=1 Tax=Pontibacter mucosus TaxID=1649266 RepID=A0A2T5YCK9_9BACT|nr:hypothetical protein C8N40_11247 [Pontibacter mucosus]
MDNLPLLLYLFFNVYTFIKFNSVCMKTGKLMKIIGLPAILAGVNDDLVSGGRRADLLEV